MKKRILSIITTIILVFSTVVTIPVYAYELPSAFWDLNSRYDTAVKSNDHAATAELGSQIVDMIMQEPSNDQTSEIIGSRAYNAAFAYYFLGDYTNAVKYFNIYLPYGKEQNWTDGVQIAENFIKQLSSSMDVYKYTDVEQKYFGARNEPHGVLYGQVSEKTQQNDSMILLYLEYGDESYFNWANLILKNAQAKKQAVEVALNFKNEGNDVRAVNASDSYLSDLFNMLSTYSDVPIYLRIGAEMNIWGTTASPDEFKSAFITIASKMRTLSNIATVWSVAHTSKWQNAEWPYVIEDFYPGDEYVDWVGVNAYPNKYFDGKKWEGVDQFNEVCFKTGYSADPVLMIKEVVDKFGSKKPIMISECGSAYKTNGSINEYHSDWAVSYLKQMYSFIPMVYPQVKLMAYFNKNISYETNYYDLDGSSELSAAYSTIVKSPWFIQNSYQNSAQTYFEKAQDTIDIDGNVTLGTYPHLYGADSITVTYYLDGNQVQAVTEVPYSVTLNDIKGTHTLKVVASGSNGSSIERTYTLKSSQTAQSADEFSDTASLSEVQKSALDNVIKSGVVNGYEDNTIRPMNTLTRAEFSTMICRAMSFDINEPCTFSDAASHWASQYINACVKAGAINGIGDNRFDPDGKITFEQAVKIITIVSGMADANEQYPSGFISAGETNGLFENLTNTQVGSDLKRIDAFMMMDKIINN